MSRKENFIFNSKQWLGDASILEMDWDVRGMHIHLLCLASQQDKPGYLIYDDKLICKVLNIDYEDWELRVKKQLLKAWKVVEVNDLFGNLIYLKQNGFVKKYVDGSEIKKKEKIADKNISNNDGEINGSDLTKITKKDITQVFAEKATPEEMSTIWNLGVQLINKQTNSESKSRSFIAKLIKDYGEKSVAEAIAQLSVKNTMPAHIQSYLSGILRGNGKGNNRGKVSL